MINNGICLTLITQLEKLRKHNRQGSIKTKERYYQAMQRFCRYLANEWQLQKLANITLPNDIPTHIYIKQLQHFIGYHRNKLPIRENKERLTFHGLRHTFTASKYIELIDKGYLPWKAKREISKLLGHERQDVTEIYLSSKMNI